MDPQQHQPQDQAPAPPSVEGDSAQHEQSASEATKGPHGAEDLTRYRSFAVLGYVLPFLFFLPLLDDETKHVPYARFHANQQLILLILAFGVYVVHNVLYITVMFSYLMLAQLLNLGLLILAVIGIYNAYNNKMKELPFVGQFRILK